MGRAGHARHTLRAGEVCFDTARFFPKSQVRGCDVEMPESLSAEDFALVNASRPFHVFEQTKFDLVLSVSGVMEFDNTLQFFEQC